MRRSESSLGVGPICFEVADPARNVLRQSAAFGYANIVK